MSSDNRISSVSISNEGPRQTPNQSFGLTLSKTLAKGASGAMGLASPLLGAVNPALSAPVTGGAAVIAKFASSGGNALPNASPGGAGHASAATSGTSAAASSSGASSEIPDGTGDSSWQMMQAQKAMNEESREFNMQYLQLQENMQRESREYQTISNVMKVRHDSAKAAINNIH